MPENNWILNDSLFGYQQEFQPPAAAGTVFDWYLDMYMVQPTGGITYYGTLKRWNGSIWVKEPMKVYLSGSWQLKDVKRWDGSEWKLIDTTGV